MWRLRFGNRLVDVGSVGEKVTLRQSFVKYCVIRIFSVSIDQLLLHNYVSLPLIIICNQQSSKNITLLPKFNLICRYLR